MPIIKLKCLDNKDVVAGKVSDHDMVLVDTSHGSVCYFNMMCRCAAREPTGFNNGFNQIETLEEYNTRLEKIAQVLAELQQDHKVVAFMLQEAPNIGESEEQKEAINFYAELKKKLANFNVDETQFARKTESTRSCTFSTFDNSVFPGQRPVLYNSPGRYQEIQLTDSKGNKLTAVNIHGDYKKQPETSQLVINWAKKGAIVGGDLNITTNTQEAINIESALGQIPAASFIIKKARNFKTIDVAISTCDKQAQLKQSVHTDK